MKSNQVKTRILPILNEIIVYSQSKSHIFLKKIIGEKIPFLNNQWRKKVRNLKTFGKIIAYLQKQLQKIAHFKNSAEG